MVLMMSIFLGAAAGLVILARVPPRPAGTPPIVLFDGVCGLCNRLVDFALRRDRRHLLRFAPLQGPTAAGLLGPEAAALDSVAVVADGTVRRRSAAVLAVLAHLGGPWRVLAALLAFIPGGLRDGAYRFIAGRRYRWFGKREACRLPSPEERDQFLD